MLEEASPTAAQPHPAGGGEPAGLLDRRAGPSSRLSRRESRTLTGVKRASRILKVSEKQWDTPREQSPRRM